MDSSKTGRPPAGKNRAATQAAARDQARLLREATRKRERRRHMLLTVAAPVAVVLLVVVGFVVVKANQRPVAAPVPPPAGTAGAASGAALATALASIPAATFDSVGAGSNIAAPAAVTGPALAAAGKPRVLYIGAEYCPYCAGERWAVVAALSRFGTFSNLGVTTSAAADVYPNTATLSFHGASYTSSLLSFTGKEVATNIPSSSGYTQLDTLSAADQQVDATYNPKGSIPFVDFGNKYVITGASYDVGVLQGLTQQQIAAQLTDPKSSVAQHVLATANMMSAAICTLTNGQPATVCSSAAVTAAHLGT